VIPSCHYLERPSGHALIAWHTLRVLTAALLVASHAPSRCGSCLQVEVVEAHLVWTIGCNLAAVDGGMQITAGSGQVKVT
jgi:hypothetical protein